MGFYATDGKHIKALDIGDVLGAGFERGLISTVDSSPRAYYAAVPFMRRAVTIRANAVANVPVTLQRGETDVSGDRAYAALMDGLKDLLWRTEFAMSLSPYGAYWKKQSNRYKLNPTPEWLLPSACYPHVTAENGLEYIRYVRPFGVAGAGRIDQLGPDDVVRFWLPSLDRASWPGVPPGVTALAAAGALANKDSFVASYFASGALKATLLSVPTATPELERNRLKTWWRDRVVGIRNAWASNVISTDITPVVVGEGLGDIGEAGKALVEQYREDTAAAFGVPISKMLSNAANFATAREENIAFYVETVFPTLALILDAINTQWLQPAYGVELTAHPEQTEAMQDAQVQQASAVTELVGSPILTVDEGRAWLGIEPMPPQEQTDTDAQDYQVMEQEANADDQVETTADQVAAKALRTESGAYALMPGTEARMNERRALLTAHAAARRALRSRHADERTQAKARHMDARNQATSAQSRLRLVRLHQNELITLSQRQYAERGMIRSLHAAERMRMRDRHAIDRHAEVTI